MTTCNGKLSVSKKTFAILTGQALIRRPRSSYSRGMADKVTALTAQRDEEMWLDRPKYPGTTKCIRGTQRRAG